MLTTYPLNNIDYSAEDAELYHCTRTSGVFASDEDFSASVSGADNIVNIGQGIAWIRNSRFSGKVVANKSSVDIDMGLADGTYPRIDAIVLQFDANKNQTDIIKKQGVAGSAPVAPEVVRTESLYELHLYHVRRRAGATSIIESDITDLRKNEAYCGVMSDDVTMLGDDFVKKADVGQPNGVASLDETGKVPPGQLPSIAFGGGLKIEKIEYVGSGSTTNLPKFYCKEINNPMLLIIVPSKTDESANFLSNTPAVFSVNDGTVMTYNFGHPYDKIGLYSVYKSTSDDINYVARLNVSCRGVYKGDSLSDKTATDVFNSNSITYHAYIIGI